MLRTIRSALAFWLTVLKAIGLSCFITLTSGLIGAYYGGLFFPFNMSEEAFARNHSDGATGAFLGIMVVVTRRILRSVPNGFRRIEPFLVTSVMLAWALDRYHWSYRAILIELVLIGWLLLWIILVQARNARTAS